MKAAAWMIGASVASSFAVAALVGVQAGAAVVGGMVGPLLAASGSWVLAERTFKRNPEALTSLMVAAFAGKMLFFGAYVVIALGVLALRPVPFVASFTIYFIALYMTEALCLRRLYVGPRGVFR
jgi:hypothetical protein